VPESLSRESGKGKGNYFGGSGAADKEAEMRRKESQRRAAETDKMSAGAGDRRREIEAKLSPQMRAKVAAEQQRTSELEQVRSARRTRARVPRKYARPVEKTLSLYNSQTTDLYDVLRVAKGVDESSLKKAYRAAALSVHPGTC
jgi:curved DNA-binding protein CbpA